MTNTKMLSIVYETNTEDLYLSFVLLFLSLSIFQDIHEKIHVLKQNFPYRLSEN